MLEDSVENLRIDLKPIEHLLIQNKECMIITHDSDKCIRVCCSLQFKAYIPKKYDGWEVIFQELMPDTDPQLDLDLTIDL